MFAKCLTEVRVDPSGRKSWVPSARRYRALLTCSRCRGPALIEFELLIEKLAKFMADIPNQVPTRGGQLQRIAAMQQPVFDGTFENFLNRLTNDQRSTNMQMKPQNGIDLTPFCKDVHIFPGAPQPPAGLPAEIDRIYRDDLLMITGSPTYVAIACRHIIETACKELAGTDRDNLAALIRRLVDSEKLPKIMAEWADTIRVLGNEAIHGSSPVDSATAHELMNFTQIFLELLYTYPARIGVLHPSALPS